MNQEKIKQLKDILALVNTDKVTKREMKDMFELLVKTTKQLKLNLESAIVLNSKESEQSIKRLEKSLSELDSVIKDSSKLSLQKIRETQVKLSEEIKKLKLEIPQMPDLSILERKIDDKTSEVKRLIPKLPEEIKAEAVRNKLETLEDEERLDVSAIKGIDKSNITLTNDIINRAIGIVDQRTSFLINKVSNLESTLKNIPSIGSSAVTPTEIPNGSTTTFTFSSKPKIVFVDGGRAVQETSNDGSVNWSYSTPTLTMTIAPVFDIFALL
jgi:seryl-tRNA synthetase